jgi:hypothetical protein
MSLWTVVRDPLQGKTSLSRVFWVYGMLGSVLVSAIGVFLASSNDFIQRAYTVFGIAFSVYVTVATYQCAGNCRSKILAGCVRVSTLIAVFVLLPLCAYLYFTGALDLALSLLKDEQ